MDILYVHPAKQEVDARYDKYRSCSPYPFIPVGVVGLVNMLRAEGWQVEGLNLPVELLIQPTFSFKNWLSARPPAKLVLIDLHWYEHCYGAMEAAKAVKQSWPKTKVVIGGLTTSNFAEEILDNFAAVDFAVRGDAEEPLKQLAKQVCGDGKISLATVPNLVFRRKGKARQNQRSYFATAADLDALDFVETEWLHRERNYAAFQYSGAGAIALRDPKLKGHWLTVARGCVFNCIYCGGGKRSHRELAGRDGYVLRDPLRVAEDVKRLKDAGYDQVSFSLDPATFRPDWWRTLFAKMGQDNVRIGLYNEFFQQPSDDFINAFAAAADLQHTEVAISPLSGNEAVRKQNGKNYTNIRLLRMLENLKRHEIPIFIYFSLNLPGETPQTFRQTLQLAEEIGRIYPPNLLRMLNPCHTLDPLSPMSRQPRKYRMDVHYKRFMDYYTYCKGTGWQPRHVIRGQHRGFEMTGRPAQTVEQMAQIWDMFAKQQKFRCFPVPRGW